MRSRRIILVVIALGSIAVTGCGNPAPTPSPTVRPTPTPVPGPTIGPAAVLNLRALNLEFNPKVLELRANVAFVIRFTNAEVAGIPHVVDIRRQDGTSLIEEQRVVPGGTAMDYAYPPLRAGDYVFMCRIHPIPSMTGTLRVR